jgi:hypothetical protein
VDPIAAFGHAFVVAVAWAMLGLLRLASAQPHPLAAPGRRPLASVEATVVLVTLDALFASFAAAQLVAVSSGGRRVIETAGLTYAEYARTGFFQLLAVAAITLTALMTLWGLADRENPSVRRRCWSSPRSRRP